MRKCLFSVSYAGFWGQHRLDLMDFIARAGRLGFDGVMIAGKRPHISPLDASADYLDRVQAGLKEAGVGCAVIAGYTDFSIAGPAEVPALEMQIGYVAALSRIAATLGAGVVRLFTAYQAEGQPFEALWWRTVEAVRECADRAAEHDVVLAVQNHHDVAVHSDAMLEFLADVGRDNCRLGFDAWSPALRGEDLYEAARKMAPHTAITTNADYVRLPRYRYHPDATNYTRAEPDTARAVRFGEGFIDYGAFFKGLSDGGFDGIASYEMCSPLRGGGSEENLDACASAYLSWMDRNGY